jgi:hypothetical protein
MTVDDLECPNCGASVDFAHGARATCAFCHSSLLLTGEGVQTADARTGARERPTAAPEPAPAPRPVPPLGLPRRMGVARLLQWGCLFAIVSQVLFVCVCGVFMTAANSVLLRTWGPLNEVTAIVNQQPAVVRALGQPITVGLQTDSRFKSDSRGTTVKFNAPLFGSRKNGKVRVEGRWLQGGWDLDIWVTYPEEDGEQEIFIQQHAGR